MGKLKVGNKWETPEGLDVLDTIGGYVIGIDEKGLYVCGKRKINMTSSKIYEARIIPILGKNMNRASEIVDGSIVDIFEVEDDDLLYLVMYNDATYVFDNAYEATRMVGFLSQYKGEALLEGMTK